MVSKEALKRETVVVIPARYRSSRFPGKPLIDLEGTPMVVRVANAAKAALSWTVVATDDDRIAKVCKDWGIECEITLSSHRTGTDRVAEVAQRLSPSYVINVQGDEPLAPADGIRDFALKSLDAAEKVTNGMIQISEGSVADVTIPKVVFHPDGRMVYISRSPIPNREKSESQPAYFRQAGVYGFTPGALEAYALHGDRGSLEKHEDVEILRFIDLDIPVRMIRVQDFGPAVDLPEHAEKVSALIRNTRAP